MANKGIGWAGLAAGPGAWAVSTVVGYVEGSHACGSGSGGLLIITLACILVAVAGSLISWPAWAPLSQPAEAHGGSGGLPYRTVAAMGVLLGGFFAVVILAQMLGPMMIGACDR
jgi:hypothetical protein